MSNANVYISLVGKDKISGTLKNVSKGLRKFKASAASVGSALAKIGTLTIAAGAAIAGGLIYATKAAADEEKGIKRLGAAIAANVKGRVDQAKVEEKIAAQQDKLAYSDGELRDSLAVLLPFTKSTEKAFKLQSVAADLARAKNMDLTDASKQIGLALNGNTRVLKQLGIQLPKTATKAQILAAIQKKVAGQADAYANSTEGQFVGLKNSLDDVTEDLGKQFLPVALELAKWAKNTLLPAIQAALPYIAEFGKNFIDAAMGIAQNVGPVITKIADFVMTKVVPAFQNFAETLFGPGGVAESVMGVVGPIINNLIPIFSSTFDSLVKLIGKVGEFIGILWGDGKGPLAIAVQAIGAAFGVFGAGLGVVYDILSGLMDLINKVIKAIAESPIGDIIGAAGGLLSDLMGGGTRAKGGPVAPGRTYLVGERGPELFRPSALGRIIPSHQLAPAIAGPGGGLSARELRAAMSGLTVYMDGQRVGDLVDARMATKIRGQRTSTRL